MARETYTGSRKDCIHQERRAEASPARRASDHVVEEVVLMEEREGRILMQKVDLEHAP